MMESDSTSDKNDISLSSFSTSQQDRSSSSDPSGRSSTGDAFDEYVGTKSAGTLERAKVVVLVFLLSLAGLTAWLWWKYATEYQESVYVEQFNQYAAIVVESFFHRVEYRTVAAASFADSLSIVALSAGMNWPFVSFSNFERRAASPRRLIGATSIWFGPMVSSEEQAAWESYAIQNEYYLDKNFSDPLYAVTDEQQDFVLYRKANWPVQDGMYRFVEAKPVSAGQGQSTSRLPIWQSAPAERTSGIAMFDQPSEELRGQVIKAMQRHQTTLYSKSQINGSSDSLVESYSNGPHAFLYVPINENLENDNSLIVGSLTIDVAWQTFWEGSVYGIEGPLTVVLENTCGQNYTFEVGTNEAMTKFLGEGSNQFKGKLGLSMETTFDDFADILGVDVDDQDVCFYRILVSPTEDFESVFLTNLPLMSGIALGAIFVFTAAVFVVYDHVIQARQKMVIQSATRSTAIIKSLFPAGIRNRLLDEATKNTQRFEGMLPEDYAMMETPKLRLQSYLSPVLPKLDTKKRSSAAGILGSEPIAEFFPATTIMYADLAGFTAWSSTREPAQVFTLLETLYGAMDKAARRLHVFKVETIGDCYVAATGMPDPRSDHAVMMAKFANTCLAQIKDLTGSLESQLGPGTSDLAFRIGIHSGPVTAGVLRGEKSRFQLFGDTMSTASKMESSGQAGKIHVSKVTADLLVEQGKSDWLQETGQSVVATGRGEITTYWLKTNFRKVHRSHLTSKRTSDFAGSSSRPSEQDADSVAPMVLDDEQFREGDEKSKLDLDFEAEEKIGRLVNYNAEVLISLLKKVIARRSVVDNAYLGDENSTNSGSVALDEVKEVIVMPQYNEEAAVKMASDYTVEIPEVVRTELRAYIHRVAGRYHQNPFHNFEHASHVALSVNKLLKRIVMPEDVDYRRSSKEKVIEKVLAVAKDLHEHTLGISSDPVAQFAVVFSALIHDVDHRGVPNFILAKEEPDIATKYRNQSIAEQRSIDVAWNILLEDDFKNLRRCMFPTQKEFRHFRQLIVNTVMATDIFDKELGALRKARWQKCFHPEQFPFPEVDKRDSFNRKATIVIEHIIQASDVAHTMQHWHVYLKWNERLFHEMLLAFKQGRSDKDPTAGWYNGELWFFDNYVIPLAHKLKECGVFGVSSAEYLQYATENRDEWERKGQEMCKRMVANFSELHST